MVDPYNNIIGAAHAGWRGAILGVVDNLINSFRMNGSNLENIYAVIGPCISKESFEVKSDMINKSIEKDPNSEKFFSSISNLDYFDLSAYIIDKIKPTKNNFKEKILSLIISSIKICNGK